jgi:hypothetical protein
MKLVFFGLIIAVFSVAVFLFSIPRTVIIVPKATVGSAPSTNMVAGTTEAPLAVPEAPAVPSSTNSGIKSPPAIVLGAKDLPFQAPLANPPETVKGIYVTGWSAGSASRINALLSLAQRTEVNAMVVDIKDFSGHVSYRTGIPQVAANGAEDEIKILQPNALIKKLHDAGIYVIGRITVFQDPILAKEHPDWALKNASSGATWKDHKGLAWMDVAATPVWDYNIAIAQNAFARGFDEVQFDYVRFASDGDLSKIGYPFWDKKSTRAAVVKGFFKYLREQLAGKKISADLFGLTTIDTWDDLGIGQVIEGAYQYFDYVSPMVYPSHYAAGFDGYKNPAAYPYEVVNYSLEKAVARLAAMGKPATTSTEAVAVPSVKLRPWLQDFDLGATYDAPMVRKQIQATYDALVNVSGTRAGYYGGWLLWDPANTYTEGALEKQ